MKRGIILALALVAAGLSADDPRQFRVATLNVHYLVVGSEERLTAWSERATAVVSVLREIDADIVAFQEMETFAGGSFNAENLQVTSIGNAFPTHRFTATGDPRVFPNTQPILYRTDLFTPVDQGFFFFSATPDRPYSRPWYGRFSSFASWARLEFREGVATRSLLIVNVHIDRTRYRNQILSARLIADRIANHAKPGEEVILLGDLNAFQRSRITRIAAARDRNARDGTISLTPVSSRQSTFHFYRGLNLFPAIDHVLASDGLTPIAAFVDRSRPNGIWPSDHYPVVADFVIE